jgi:hypothetical protein
VAKPGEFLSVTVTDVVGYDLMAQPVGRLDAQKSSSSTSPALLMPKKNGAGYR